MRWSKLYIRLHYLLNFPACLLVFITCSSATIGILYLQDPFENVFQYLPAAASAAYLLSRFLVVVDKGIVITRDEFLGYALVVSTGLSVAIQMHLGLDAVGRDGLSSLDYTVAMWVFNMFYFFAGAASNNSAYKKSDIVALTLALMVLVPFIYAPKQFVVLDYYALRQSTGMDGLTHLLIAEWCVFLFIGAFAFANDRLRPFIFIAAAICLFGMQGRSSTVFTLFTLLGFWLLTGGKRVVFISAAVAAFVGIVIQFLPIADLLQDSNEAAVDRMLLNGGEDGSLDARTNIFFDSLQYLPRSMLYGDPTYIANEAGSMGSYIHNILSMWQFFGLLPLLLILIILVRSLLLMKARLKIGQLSVMEEIGCMVLIYSAVSVVLAKSVVFYWLWFAAGYWMLHGVRIPHYSSLFDVPKPSKKPRGKRGKRRTLSTKRIRF